MNYTTIPKAILQIDNNNKFVYAYTYSYIKSREDYNTHKVEISRYDISKNADISFRTVKSAIPFLKKKSFLFKEVISKNEVFETEKSNIRTHNIFVFHSKLDNYFFLNNSFFKESIDAKLKGFLLCLKSICLNGTNKYISQKPYKGKINLSELASKLNINVSTLSKLLVDAIKFEQVVEIENGLLILNRSIIPDYVESNDSKNLLYTKVYHLIYYFCLDNGIVPPNRNDKVISHIAAKYNITNDIIELEASKLGMDITTFIEYASNDISSYSFLNSYLPYILSKRITTMPTKITWQYIASTLNVDIANLNENEVWYMIL